MARPNKKPTIPDWLYEMPKNSYLDMNTICTILNRCDTSIHQSIHRDTFPKPNHKSKCGKNYKLFWTVGVILSYLKRI